MVTSVLDTTHDIARSVGATDVMVYRRAAGERFVLTGPTPAGVTGELVLDDEAVVREALVGRVRRVANETPVAICGGYSGCAAAVVGVDPDVVVVLGCRDGCLAGVSDLMLLGAASAAAAAQAAGV